MKGRVIIVGLGPGSENLVSEEVKEAILKATDIVGYKKYTERITPRKGLTIHSSDNKFEISRAKLAVNLALDGKKVVIVSSGDPGIFAMSSAFFEYIEETDKNLDNIEIKVMPGISSMLAASSKVGSPLGHDFCVINLSDNLKPWSLLKKRIVSAIKSDFVIVFFNPRSRARPETFKEALDLFKKHSKFDRFILFAKSVYKKNENLKIIRLSEANYKMADMNTLVIIGSTLSKVIKKKQTFFYTPRSYNH
tara:strand:- start:860 stop:1609 length:750 start_codon:yes stop_codon:yes gene_type:complete